MQDSGELTGILVTAMLSLILLIFAFVLACLAAFNVGQPRWSLGWASLACYFLSLILGNAALHR